MMHNNRYYIVEGGEILDACHRFRQDFKKYRIASSSFMEEHGIEQAHEGFGYIKFGGEVPKGFTKPGRDGFTKPRKTNKEWTDILRSAPRAPDVDSYIKPVLDWPHSVNYEFKNGSGCNTLASNFWSMFQVCFYSEDGPMLLIVPDVEKKLSYLRKNYEEVATNVDNLNVNIDGAREIIREEWDFMAAKHKKEHEA